jgi:hypothetical protein
MVIIDGNILPAANKGIWQLGIGGWLNKLFDAAFFNIIAQILLPFYAVGFG